MRKSYSKFTFSAMRLLVAEAVLYSIFKVWYVFIFFSFFIFILRVCCVFCGMAGVTDAIAWSYRLTTASLYLLTYLLILQHDFLMLDRYYRHHGCNDSERSILKKNIHNSTLVSIHPCIRVCPSVGLSTPCFINRFREFHQIYNFGGVRDKDEPVTFEIKRSKIKDDLTINMIKQADAYASTFLQQVKYAYNY